MSVVLEYFGAFLDAKTFINSVLGIYLWDIILCLETCVVFSLLHPDFLWIIRRVAK